MKPLTLKLLLAIMAFTAVAIVVTRKQGDDEYLITAMQGTAWVQSRVTHDLGAIPSLSLGGEEGAKLRELAKISDWAPLQPGTRIHPGDTVRTDPASWVDLMPTSGIGVRVAAESVMQLEKISEQEHAVMEARLESGKGLLRVLAQKLHGKGGYRPNTEMLRVKTPVATAGIRGTSFSVAFDPATKLATVAVAEGAVNVRSLLAPETGVNVPAGHKAKVADESRFPPLLPLEQEDQEELALIEQIKLEFSLGDKMGRAVNLQQQAIEPTFNRIVAMITNYEMNIFKRAIVTQAPLLWNGAVPPSLHAVPLQEGSDYLDPWDTEYYYEVLGPKTAVIISAGPDKRLHSQDDLFLKIEM